MKDDRDASANIINCNICELNFINKTKMKEHGKVDPDPKFPCSECGKMLTQKSSLRVHVMLRHTGEKPFNIPKLPCLECDKMLKVKQALRTHIMAT